MKRSNDNSNQSHEDAKKARHNPNNSSDNVFLTRAAPLRLKQSTNRPSKIYQKYSTNIIRRTVYLGNLPPNVEVYKLINQIKVGPLESVKLHPDRICAFISFMNATLAKAFYDEATNNQIFYEGQELYVGWGRLSAVPLDVQLAVEENNASRNVLLENLDDSITERILHRDLAEYGYIDTIQIIREKKIGLVHFWNISSAIRAVESLPSKYAYKRVKVDYAKDRCEIYMENTLLQSFGNKASHNPYLDVMSTTRNPYLNDVTTTRNPYLNNVSIHDHNLNGMSSTHNHSLNASTLFNKRYHPNENQHALSEETMANVTSNVGNRSVYLGNIHPSTRSEEICNYIRAGNLECIQYIPKKQVAFVRFLDPNSATSFLFMAQNLGLVIKNRKLKAAWGDNPGPLPKDIEYEVKNRHASRNIYIGKLGEGVTEEKLYNDFKKYGEIESTNLVKEKSCGFVNFMSISSAIRAMKLIKGNDDYKDCYINYGKDRCGDCSDAKNRKLKSAEDDNPGPLTEEDEMNNRPASRNVYIEKLGEEMTEEKLYKDFKKYGKIESIILDREKSCGFVNFMSIGSGIRAVKRIKRKSGYKHCNINYGKDRCDDDELAAYTSTLASETYQTLTDHSIRKLNNNDNDNNNDFEPPPPYDSSWTMPPPSVTPNSGKNSLTVPALSSSPTVREPNNKNNNCPRRKPIRVRRNRRPLPTEEEDVFHKFNYKLADMIAEGKAALTSTVDITRRLTNSSSTSSDFEYFGSAPPMSSSFDYGYGLAQSGYSSPTGYDSPPIGFYSANNTSSTAINTNTTTSSSSKNVAHFFNSIESDISRGEIVKNTEKTIQIIQFEVIRLVKRNIKRSVFNRVLKSSFILDHSTIKLANDINLYVAKYISFAYDAQLEKLSKYEGGNDEKTGLFMSHRRTLGVMFLTAIVSDLESVVEYEQENRVGTSYIDDPYFKTSTNVYLAKKRLISSITDEIINGTAIVFSRAYPEVVAGKVKSSGLSCILVNLQY
nr:14369_t:CDS:10 [Entrophospora candida]